VSTIDARRTRPAPARPTRKRAASKTTTRRIAPTTAALMALCALVLVGVVFVQIAVIRGNMDRSDLESHNTSIQAQNRDLAAKIGRAESSPRIAEQAKRLGMVLAPPSLAHPLTGHPLNGG
jgi:cell division protein FtsL